MNITAVLNDKTIKAKAKTQTISTWLLETQITLDELLNAAEKSKDTIKATCIEALEYATKTKPSILDESGFHFMIQQLQSKAPRVKWESARVIGNTAKYFQEQLDNAIPALLITASDEGTVVRWSAAFALSEILQLKTKHQESLLPKLKIMEANETQSSIRKIYAAAIKKASK
jgi:HEAT repeat protein